MQDYYTTRRATGPGKNRRTESFKRIIELIGYHVFESIARNLDMLVGKISDVTNLMIATDVTDLGSQK